MIHALTYGGDAATHVIGFGSYFSGPKTLLVLLIWTAAWIIPWCALCYGAYFFVTLPLRRRERALLFLDIVENALKRGERVENVLVDLSRLPDAIMGVRFHLVASHLEAGARLGEALDKVPRFLPPQVTAVFKVCEEAGDLRRAIPASRMVLQDANSQVQGALNYLVLVAFVLGPATPLVFLFLYRFILPAMQMVLDGSGFDMGLSLSGRLFSAGYTLAWIQLGLSLFLYALAGLYIGGPRLSGYSRMLLGIAVDRLHFALSWRRNRMRRDFANMLATLLDSSVPEGKAVELAGRTAANQIFSGKVNQVVNELQSGSPLPLALQRLDDSEQLQWRLANAARGGSFQESLHGWLAFLDAKAFRQEQTAAQLTSTLFLVLNAILIGLIAAGVFGVLVDLIHHAALW